jgi:Arf-GAP/coiled-coil/ANK repeat/PH domain-containing protein
MSIKPIESLQDDVLAMKESSRKWQRMSSLTDACAIKVAGLKKNSTKLDESEAELADLKKQTATAAIEMGTSLNTLTVKRRLAVIDSACRYLELQKTYLDEYQALVKDCLPEMQACRSHIKAEMDEIPEATKRIPLAVLQDASISGYLQGYLYRKTKMNFTRRSYFILENGILSCFENLDSGEPKWKLDMLICTVKPSPEATRNFCFDVISPQKSRTLQADSQETMQRWITAIQEAVSTQLDKQRIGRPGRRGSSASSAAKSNEEASEELKKREEAINSLYESDVGNRKCADCSDNNPTWISINLGILICLECSGIHRSMGTHISKIRSLTLDTLHHETKTYITALGNRRVNEIYGPDVLTAIPTSFGERLHPHSTRKDREAWIKAKYAEKIFVETFRGASIQLDLVAAIRQQDVHRCMALYAQGANLNFKYEGDVSRQPLHYAADGDNALVLMFLLQNGAQVNVKDANGMTPLHIAASGHVACASMLCRMRAKDVADNNGQTALDVALESQNADVITLLRLAKLARDGGGIDEKSFSEALDSFSLDIHRLASRQSAPLKRSADGRLASSSIATSSLSSSPVASSSNLPIPATSSSPDAVDTRSPGSKSSFSFLSKLDTKKR